MLRLKHQPPMLIYHNNSIYSKNFSLVYILMNILPTLSVRSSYICCFELPCEVYLVAFRVFMVWGIFKGYARAFGSTFDIFFELYRQLWHLPAIIEHSVSLVARRDTTLICICKCIRVRNHTIDHLCNTSCLQVVLYILTLSIAHT